MKREAPITLTVASELDYFEVGDLTSIGLRTFEILSIEGRTMTVAELVPTRWERFRRWVRRIRFRSPVYSRRF